MSGVDELTDSGGATSLILDAGWGTDIEVAAPAVWLKTAMNWLSVTHTWPTHSLSTVSSWP